MNIHQILPNLSYGDAIGDDTLALKRIFKSMGYDSKIFAAIIHRKLIDEAESWINFKKISSPENVMVYHFSVGSGITDSLIESPDKLIVVFHNITPSHWFYGNSPHMTEVTADGMKELRKLKDRSCMAWADSEYNASILREAGYRNVHVLPIIVEMTRLDIQPHPIFSRQWSSSQFTWTFVGRISPNKCHQDIIRAFACYKKWLHPHSRLIFVGENRNCSRYVHAMEQLVRDLGIADVYFTGMIDTSELVAIYRMTDVFMCMSEHEGFCVPLLEAMHFDIPVVAFDAGAVKETMGGAGLLVQSKHPVELAELVDLLRLNSSFRQGIVEKQRVRLQKFLSVDMAGRVKQLLQENL